MSRGAGWVERALRSHFDAVAADGKSFWQVNTASLCLTVYGIQEVTEAQRVAVRRVLRRLCGPPPEGWDGQWRLRKFGKSHGWTLSVKPSDERPTADQATVVLHRKLVGLLGMMGSAHEGERANAAALADRLLRDADLTGHDVVSVPPKAR